MALLLRPYQKDIVSQARSLMMRGCRSMLICSPTGSGKTALTADMLSRAAKKNMRSFFVVHRRELINQSAMAFHKADVFHGIIANQYPEDPRVLVNIASVQTLARRLHKYPSPNLIIWDECHHIAAGTWSKIFNYYPKAFHIGLTATPERLDGKGLNDFFKVMIKGPDVRWLIEHDYLADYKLYAPSNLDMTGVKKQMGDYKRADVEKLVDKPVITGSAINEYKKVANGKRAIAFCASVKHSEHVVNQFNANGISAMHVDGTTRSEVRDKAIKDFSEGKIKVLSNVDLFGEGFDVPALEVSILLRPTQSLSLYLQQVGRALRPAPGKTQAIILDHVGNVERHGLPDEVREWNLGGREKQARNKEKTASIRICDQCFAAQLPGRSTCKHCGHVFEKQHRKIDEVEGDLVELTTEEIAKRRARKRRGYETHRSRSMDELVELGKKRGYKNPRGWAKHIFNARQAKKIGMNN